MHLPPAYAQRDLARQIDGSENSFVARVADSSEIEYRHFCEDPAEFLNDVSVRHGYHDRHVADMAASACRDVLDADDNAVRTIDVLIAVNTTGISLPGLAETLILRHEIGEVGHTRGYNLVGHGCAGGLYAMELAWDLIEANRADTVLIVCSEPLAALFEPGQVDRSVQITHVLFGEASVAVILARKTPSAHAGAPYLTDVATDQEPEAFDGVRLSHNGNAWMPTVLHRVASCGPRLGARVAKRVLDRNGLATRDVKHWALHTGGKAILDGMAEGLDIAEDAMSPNRANLRDNGNTESCAVFLSLHRILQSGRAAAGDYGMILGMGPGMSASAFLIQWPESAAQEGIRESDGATTVGGPEEWIRGGRTVHE